MSGFQKFSIVDVVNCLRASCAIFCFHWPCHQLWNTKWWQIIKCWICISRFYHTLDKNEKQPNDIHIQFYHTKLSIHYFLIVLGAWCLMPVAIYCISVQYRTENICIQTKHHTSYCEWWIGEFVCLWFTDTNSVLIVVVYSHLFEMPFNLIGTFDSLWSSEQFLFLLSTIKRW